MKLLHDLFYTDGAVSLTRVCTAFLLLLFAGVSIYLVWRGTTWGNYETFATVTGGGGAASRIAQLFIDSKYNSPAGEVPKKGCDPP